MALKPEARQERLAMARRFERGELSRTEFCKRERISKCKLNYWLKNLELERNQHVADAQFIEVVVSEPVRDQQQVTCEVELPHGVKLRFFGPTA